MSKQNKLTVIAVIIIFAIFIFFGSDSNPKNDFLMAKGVIKVTKQLSDGIPFHISSKDIENQTQYREQTYLTQGIFTVDEYILFINTEAEKEGALLFDKEKKSLIKFYGKNFVMSKNTLWYTTIANHSANFDLTKITDGKIMSVNDTEEITFLPSGSYNIDHAILSVNTENNSMVIRETQKHTVVFLSGKNFAMSNQKDICYTDNNDQPSSLSIADIPLNNTKNGVLLIFNPKN